ncbi:MAG: DUF1800 family protein [Verrucomicrobiales bacterium]
MYPTSCLPRGRVSACLAIAATLSLAPGIRAQGYLLGPQVRSVELDDAAGQVVLDAALPPGFRHAVLEVLDENQQWQPLVSGPTTGATAEITFRAPMPNARGIYRVRAGDSLAVPFAPLTGGDFFLPIYGTGGAPLDSGKQITHLLNRIAYGPSAGDYADAQSAGIEAFIESQLAPAGIDDSGNAGLQAGFAPLFHSYVPYSGAPFVKRGDVAKFFRGTEEPPAGWNDAGFDDSGWESGVTVIGYGDGDDDTVIEGMQDNYLSLYLRCAFTVDDPAQVENLILNLIYDDGMVAYLNGVEVARGNMTQAGSPPPFNATADRNGGSAETDDPGEFDLSAFKGLLQPGENVIAVQCHNYELGSSDMSLAVDLASYPDAPFAQVKGIRQLQDAIHVRGIYTKRQLEAVLAEFWENHFTTDYDKVHDYLEGLDEFKDLEDIDDPREYAQTRLEAARMEWDEYEFFRQHALGNFGDLLLYSATSPSMLIYLDSVLNRVGAPNENYAREILELHAFGVDNRYTQGDIEQLAKCFTGWTVRKVRAADKLPFPQSARTPPSNGSVAIESVDARIEIGDTWRYFKGTAEPTPDGGGLPTLGWAQPGFNDAGWLQGATSIGMGDSDDATELTDMKDNYVSVYLRTEFTLPAEYDDLIFEVEYDDGYIAYLNGVEVSRSGSMRNAGEPPAFDQTSDYSHEAVNDPDEISLAHAADLLNPPGQPNTLAIQVHNVSLSNGDLSIFPRILARTYTPDSIPVIDPLGVWTFRFDPAQHDTEAKVIFGGTPHQIDVPAKREGMDGLLDALEVIDAMVEHPSTAEFICLKLVNRFVSDEISLDTYQDRTAPDWLLAAMDDAIAAWNATAPAGNIETVLRAILDPSRQASAFWLDGAYLMKVKSPVEFINSAYRAIGADIEEPGIYRRNSGMGMTLFERDDPDGFDEKGIAWTDTLGLLERMRFSQAIASNSSYAYGIWDLSAFSAARGVTDPPSAIDYFNGIIFQGGLTPERQAVLLDYANTNDAGDSSPYESLSTNAKATRLSQTIGLILAAPEFQFQ